jgi:hypothetical protein
MIHLLSVENIAFTVLGYPMSYIEFVGTIHRTCPSDCLSL